MFRVKLKFYHGGQKLDGFVISFNVLHSTVKDIVFYMLSSHNYYRSVFIEF